MSSMLRITERLLPSHPDEQRNPGLQNAVDTAPFQGASNVKGSFRLEPFFRLRFLLLKLFIV